MSDLPTLIETIERIKSRNQFHRYIDFIRFPFYRNIEVDTQIVFEFPLTVFIGQNGCGKSSCLHALYGAPVNHTPYTFWFDTKVDPISYYDEQRKRHSFWYSFRDEKGQIKEVIKARIRRNEDPNYWETSRPLAWAGMKTRPNRNDRDSPISKNVVYLDFRSELSAFDKFFYFGNTKNLASRNKQEFIRRKSTSLNRLLSGEIPEIRTKVGVANNPIRHLTSLELEKISLILGKNYVSGEYLEHQLYRNNGYSVVFRTNYGNYSEAFAGSGEVAVVRLVLQILDAPEYSLILLDEPEVSLHPGAQSRLKLFLLEQIKIKKHQIIITSHSPSIVRGLPREAIKVFYQNPGNGRFLVKENLTPEEAFYHIEFPVDNKKSIVVEDVLAKNIIDGVLKSMGEETANLINVKFNPGGESVIKQEFIPVFCREKNTTDYVFFDGDQRPKESHHDWRSFSQTQLSEKDFIKTKIKEQTGKDIKFSVDGGESGGNHEQQIELGKKYLDFYLTNTFYLPKEIPEEIIWDETFAYNQVNMTILNETDANEYRSELDNTSDMKQKFALLAEILYGNSNADNIASVHKQFIQRWLNLKNDDFNNIKSAIESILK